MVLRHFTKHFNNVKNFANNVYKGIGVAHKIYNVVSPALRQLGVNTALPDMVVNRGFDAYNQLRNKVTYGNHVLSRTAGQLSALGN